MKALPRHLVSLAASFVLLAFPVSALQGQPLAKRPDLSADDFANPPVASRPTTWWYWGESVTTDHGITRDLEALRDAGFGGVVLYEQVFADRPDALKSLSPEFLARVRFAAAECARLGLKLEVNASNGFVAGGPWITPELGMQRLVATESVVAGGRRVSVVLPRATSRHNFYRDVAVLAYPTPAGGTPNALPAPAITSQPATPDAASLFAGPDAKKIRLAPPPGGGPVLIALDYGRPVTIRALTYALRPNSKALVIATQVPTSWADDFYGQGMRLNPPVGTLESSTDGTTWTTVCTLSANGSQHDYWDIQTRAFPAATARHFRLRLEGWGRNTTYKDDDLVIGNIELHPDARIDQWEEKAGHIVDFSNPDQTPAYAAAEVIDPARIVDLTDHLSADGHLDWDAPPGSWTVLRFGHIPTGARTKHGRPEGMGLECDKLSAAAVAVQFQNYVGRILAEVRTVPGAKLAGINVDSNEHGSQNWTAAFPDHFRRLRGYDLRRLLPVMAGRVVGSPADSDRFLNDVRRTIADLMSDEYFGALRSLCHAEGMTLMAQAPGIATCLPSDNIQAKGRTDIPMAEFWMSQADGTLDCKEAASAAHVYGLPVVAAESFTGSRADAHPAMMKPFADAALAHGINQFVVLAYVHQPREDRLPGVTQDRFYVPFQRHNTWWRDSRPFWDTLARSSHVLRQGLPVADILYHLGNDTPLKIATHRLRPVPPAGYDYDVCGDEVLLTRTRVANGRIVLPDGMSYSLLILAGGPELTLPAARRLRELVAAGATVLGPVKPTGTRSFADGPDGSAEVRRIADELWGHAPLTARGEKSTGAGRLLWGYTPTETLARLNLPRDFYYEAGPEGADLLHAHRRTADRDLYFVANHQNKGASFTASFRVTGRIPELWNPETGAITALPDYTERDGITRIPLALEARASVFVVFRDPALPGPTAPAPLSARLVSTLSLHQEIPGPWQVAFTSGRGAPARAEFVKLISWTEHFDAGIRHFSGDATYTRDFDYTPPAAPGRV
ncbi:MAG: hypothetical protein RLZZ50_899, partial [Verrucomicrobiota bacterium]